MENLTVSNIVNLFPSSKGEQSVFVGKLIDSVLGGNENPLKVESQMANIEQVVKAYRGNKEIKDAVLTEAEKYGAKTFEAYNCQVQIKETGVKYNYLEVGHLDYNSICAAIDDLTAKKKAIEGIMQGNTSPWIYTNPDTGETYEVQPLAKSSTTQAVLTINK